MSGAEAKELIANRVTTPAIDSIGLMAEARPSTLSAVLLARCTDRVEVGHLHFIRDDDGMSVSIAVRTEHQHQGYGAEALDAAIRWFCRKWSGVDRILPLVYTSNLASAALINAVSFRRTSTKDGQVWDWTCP